MAECHAYLLVRPVTGPAVIVYCHLRAHDFTAHQGHVSAADEDDNEVRAIVTWTTP